MEGGFSGGIASRAAEDVALATKGFRFEVELLPAISQLRVSVKRHKHALAQSTAHILKPILNRSSEFH